MLNLNKSNSKILIAVMSKLISNKDNVLAQLDLILNKNISDKGISNIVEQATNLFIELSNIESAIESVKFTIESNANTNQFSEQIGQLKETLTKLQQNNNQETHGDNS